MRQYNLEYYDEERTQPCVYIIEHDEKTFEGFFFSDSIGMFDNVAVAARTLWYRIQLLTWQPTVEQRKLPN